MLCFSNRLRHRPFQNLLRQKACDWGEIYASFACTYLLWCCPVEPERLGGRKCLLIIYRGKTNFSLPLKKIYMLMFLKHQASVCMLKKSSS